MKLSIFDFDGTIYRRDSLITFAKFSRGSLPFFKAILKSLPAIIAWKSGLRSNSEAKESLFSNLYKGIPLSFMEKRAEEFADEIDKDLNKNVITELCEAARRGERIIIITASVDFWIRPWVNKMEKRLNIRIPLLSTEAQISQEGIITGKFATPNCHGYEKVRRLKSFLKQESKKSPNIPHPSNLPHSSNLPHPSNSPKSSNPPQSPNLPHPSNPPQSKQSRKFPEANISLKQGLFMLSQIDIAVWTDSQSDLPLLSHASRPHLINPRKSKR